MKLVVFVAIAPLALAACNPSTFSGGSATGNNSMAAVPVTPDAVIVNGVTYVRASSGSASVTPSASPTTMPPSTMPTAAPTSSSPLGPPAETAPSSSSNPDGSDVSGSHPG
jgi:hypothetical protein